MPFHFDKQTLSSRRARVLSGHRRRHADHCHRHGRLLSARVAGKEAATSTDWEEAGTLAQAGVEHAISYLNAQVAANPTTWRNSFTSYTTGNAYVFTQSMGRGTWSWVVKDKVDGNFSNNYADPFTLYGIGVVNQAKRVYSVQVVPAGSPLDVLRCGMQAGGQVTINKPVSLGAGPLSSNTKINTGGMIYGNVETPSQSGSSSNVTGTLTCPAPTKPMPSAGLYNLYLAKATTIPWASVSSGITNQLLSSTNNPLWLPLTPTVSTRSPSPPARTSRSAAAESSARWSSSCPAAT